MRLGKLAQAVNAALSPIDIAIVRASRKGGPFDHKAAQVFELRCAEEGIRRDFRDLYERWDSDRKAGGLWHGPDHWFANQDRLWNEFVAHVRDKKCLEIGAGPFGYLPLAHWIKDRTVIDPLADDYRRIQIEALGKTFYTDDIRRIAQPAEVFVDDIRGRVDGAIICRNALDHMDDPLAVLDNISEYAAPGCYLLLWTDLWHLAGLDEGHRNITRSVRVMDKMLRGLGFEILPTKYTIRDPSEYIEYGALARKL